MNSISSNSGTHRNCHASCRHSPVDGPVTTLPCLALHSAPRVKSAPSGVQANPGSSGAWIRARFCGMPAQASIIGSHRCPDSV